MIVKIFAVKLKVKSGKIESENWLVESWNFFGEIKIKSKNFSVKVEIFFYKVEDKKFSSKWSVKIKNLMFKNEFLFLILFKIFLLSI